MAYSLEEKRIWPRCVSVAKPERESTSSIDLLAMVTTEVGRGKNGSEAKTQRHQVTKEEPSREKASLLCSQFAGPGYILERCGCKRHTEQNDGKGDQCFQCDLSTSSARCQQCGLEKQNSVEPSTHVHGHRLGLNSNKAE